MSARAALFVGALALAGCRDAPAPAATCDARGAKLGISLDVEIDVASALPRAAAREVEAGLDAFASCAGATLHARVVRRDLAPPFTLGHDALDALGPDEAERALVRPLADLVATLGATSPTTLHVVLLPSIATPDAAARAVLVETAGLGIPAAFEGGATMPWQRALPEPRGPVVLLSYERWPRMTLDARAALIAHEVGHALGLAHDARAGNAMAREDAEHPGWLDADQVERMRHRAGFERDAR